MWSMPEALEGALAGLPDVLRRAVDAAPVRVIGVAQDAELGRDDDAVAAAGDRAADEPLVRVRAVHVGGVEEGYAELQRPLDRRDRLAVVARAVEVGHAHAAESLAGDGQALAAELDGLHGGAPFGVLGEDQASSAL